MNPMKRKIFAIVTAAGMSSLTLLAWAQTPARTVGGLDGQMATLNDVHSRVQLSEPQKLQWHNVVAQTTMAHDKIAANVAELKSAREAELSKKEPDLAALAALSDRLQIQNMAQRMRARAAWLALYDSLSADQKALVRDAMKARLEQHQALTTRMPQQQQ